MFLCNFCFENKKLILISSRKHIYFIFLSKSLQQNMIFFYFNINLDFYCSQEYN